MTPNEVGTWRDAFQINTNIYTDGEPWPGCFMGSNGHALLNFNFFAWWATENQWGRFRRTFWYWFAGQDTDANYAYCRAIANCGDRDVPFSPFDQSIWNEKAYTKVECWGNAYLP